jgi:exonuclease III
MTKIRPKSVAFGCKSKKHDEEARTIMAEFKTFGVALAYCPTAGIKEGALAEKLEFENIFRNHCQTQMKRTCKPLFVLGD